MKKPCGRYLKGNVTNLSMLVQSRRDVFPLPCVQGRELISASVKLLGLS